MSVAGHAALKPTGEQQVLLVTFCTGARCAGLRRLDGGVTPGGEHRARKNPPLVDGDQGRGTSNPSHREGDAGASVAVLRAAVVARPDAVLVATPCLGPCNRGSVTAIGWALSTPRGMRWAHHPLLLERSETPDRARALAGWITGAAPDPATIPAALHAR